MKWLSLVNDSSDKDNPDATGFARNGVKELRKSFISK
jgi:hypothetical protein